MLAGLKRVMSGGSQTAALLAIGVSAIAYGAVEPKSQLIVVWIVIVGLLLTFRWPATSVANQRWMVPIIIAWFGWIAFVVIQFTIVPKSVISRFAPFTNLIRTKFVGENVSVPTTLSLVPYAGQSEWPLYAIGSGFFLLGAVAFPRRSQRLRLWWAIALIGMVLPILALVLSNQNISESITEKLGVVEGDSLAAMLLLSLACLIGCFFEWMRPAVREQIKRVARLNQIPVRSGRRGVRAGLDELDRRTVWNRPATYLFLGPIIYLTIAIAWTGSFILCTAVFATIICWSIAVRRIVPGRGLQTLAVLSTVLLVGLITHLAIWLAQPEMLGQRESAPSLTLAQQMFHWSDALDTAFDSPRVGTGLGTYPYVHLLHLDYDSPHWVRDPKSMLLKWLVETGVFGVGFIAAGTAFFVILIRRLFFRRLTSTIFLGSFSVGMIAGLVLLIVSVLDSVILTPVVFWSYAIVLGSVGTTVRELRTNTIRSIQSGDEEADLDKTAAAATAHTPLWARVVGHPYPWVILAVIAIYFTQPYLRQQIDDQAVLATIPLPKPDFAPTEEESAEVRERLSSQIATGTMNSEFSRLSGIWELAEYRRSVVQRMGDQGTRVPWSKTAPQSYFYVRQSMPEDEQQQTVQKWRGDKASLDLLESAIAKFEASLALNPLQPDIHLLDAHYSSLTDRNERRAIINAKRLASGNADVRFEIGKIGWSTDDVNLMTDQWKRVIAVPSDHTFSVLRMSKVKMSPEMVIDQIIADAPDERWAEIYALCLEHEILSPLRPLVRRALPATDDG